MKRFEKFAVFVAFVLALSVLSSGQITIPHTFTTSVPVSQLNTNISTLGTGALNRAGGTITGNITVSSGVTIDGVDVGSVLGGSGTGAFNTVTTASTGATSIDVAGGITAGTGNVAIVNTSGKIPALTSTYFASLDGANLTSVVASNLSATAWSSVSYSAGDFTANGSMTWGVDVGDVASNNSIRIGNTLHWTGFITASDVAGTANTSLRVDIPGSIAGGVTCQGPMTYSDAGGAPAQGYWRIVPAGTYIEFYKDFNAVTNWTLTSADNTSVLWNLVCSVA